MLSEGKMMYFGEKWDAPVTDDAEQIPTPTSLVCMHCWEHFAEGDRGTINLAGTAEHRECGLRSALCGIGHHVDHLRYCKGDLGPDAGLSRRVSAILVWAQFQRRARLAVEDIEALRRAMPSEHE